MFEFEKRIMKAENRFPLVGYPYKVTPISKAAKVSFAKYIAKTSRAIPNSEVETFIKKHSNFDREPFVGTVQLYADTPHPKEQVQMIVKMRLGDCGISGIDYSNNFGTYKSLRHVLGPLILGEDYIIDIGEKFDIKPVRKLTWNDIKAL